MQNPLARIPGVGQVRIFGAGPYSMRVWLDPKRLQTFTLAGHFVQLRIAVDKALRECFLIGITACHHHGVAFGRADS